MSESQRTHSLDQSAVLAPIFRRYLPCGLLLELLHDLEASQLLVTCCILIELPPCILVDNLAS